MWGDKSTATLVGLGHHWNTGESPITPFEDQICGPKVTYHFDWIGLPHGGINQQAAVVPQLQNRGVQQAHPCGTVAGVEMVRFDAFDVTGGIHQAIGRVRGDGHSAAEIVHKKAIGAPLAGVAPGLESIVHCLKITLYVLDEIVDLAGAI